MGKKAHPVENRVPFKTYQLASSIKKKLREEEATTNSTLDAQ